MDEPTLPGERISHLRWLVVLLLVATGLRAWQLTHTEVMTRDGIAYARYAWRLQHEPLPHVLLSSPYHPGYPATIAAMSVPVRLFVPDDLPRAMQLSAQFVSCLAGSLLVVPMYFLGCEWFSRRVGFAAALLFQVLPASGRMLPDGLTEPLFLLLSASALLFASRGIRTGRVGWFLLAGLASGCAYLTRTEGLLLAAVTGLVILGLQFSKRWQRGWLVAGRDAAALSAATLAVALPFMVVIGGLTSKPSAVNMFAVERAPKGLQVEPVALAGLPLGTWNFDPSVCPEDRYGWAAKALVEMIDKCFFHVLTLPFLAGLFLYRRRMAKVPALWLPLALMAVLLPLVYRLGQANGYLGERHVMLVVLCGIYWAAAAVDWLATALPVLSARFAPRLARVPASGWATAFLLVLVALPLPKTLAPLHGDRAGFRRAGEWLADHAPADAILIDPFAWSSYYAGRRIDSERYAPQDPQLWSNLGRGTTCYVILDRSQSKHEHLWYLLGPAEALATKGEVIQRFPTKRRKQASEVVVYRVKL